jgi:hypothetical protein
MGLGRQQWLSTSFTLPHHSISYHSKTLVTLLFTFIHIHHKEKAPMFIDYEPEKIATCFMCKTRKICQRKSSLQQYVCSNCLTRQRYSHKNATTKGKKQKRLPTFSLEFEVQHPSPSDEGQPQSQAPIEAAFKLLQHHFIRTSDGSVADEYKSPLYHSLTAFYPALTVMDDLKHLVGDKCGTHLHVECQTKEDLAQGCGEVFGPLVEHLLTHPHESLLFWGRHFNHYASHLYDGRYFLFNTHSDHPTLEFRLPRFRNKEQYLAVVKFARSCTALLDKKMPLIKQQPSLLPTLGQEVLELYLSFVPSQQQPTWFDALPKEHQDHLRTITPGWRKLL